MTGPDARGRWLPLALIEKHVYCARQAVLAERERWTDNPDTAAGLAIHARVDSGVTDHRRGLKVHHRVPVRHDGLRLHGIVDTVEESSDGRLVPVEVKVGRRSHLVDTSSAMQAVAQACCLQAMTGRPVPTAVVYHKASNSRTTIEVASTLPSLLGLLEQLRADLSVAALPPWTSAASRCRRCSLRPTCLPELRAYQLSPQ